MGDSDRADAGLRSTGDLPRAGLGLIPTFWFSPTRNSSPQQLLVCGRRE